MLLDDGILTIYREIDVSEKGNQPKMELEQLGRAWYKKYGVTITENYVDTQDNTEVNGKVRIWRVEELDNHNILKLMNGRFYSIVRIYQGLDDDGLKISDITLGKVCDEYADKPI